MFVAVFTQCGCPYKDRVAHPPFSLQSNTPSGDPVLRVRHQILYHIK